MTTRIAAASFAALLFAGSLAGATFAQTPAAAVAAPAAPAATVTTVKTTLAAKDTVTKTSATKAGEATRATKVVRRHRVKKTRAVITKVRTVKGEAKIGGAVLTKVSAKKVVKTAVVAPAAQ
jgi:hypothetical protein